MTNADNLIKVIGLVKRCFEGETTRNGKDKTTLLIEPEGGGESVRVTAFGGGTLSLSIFRGAEGSVFEVDYVERPNPSGGSPYRNVVNAKRVRDGDKSAEEPFFKASSTSWAESDKAPAQDSSATRCVHGVSGTTARDKCQACINRSVAYKGAVDLVCAEMNGGNRKGMMSAIELNAFVNEQEAICGGYFDPQDFGMDVENQEELPF